MLEKDGLQLLVVMGELQFDFGQILFQVDLDDAFQDVLLLLRGELAILENLCKHNYNSLTTPQNNRLQIQFHQIADLIKSPIILLHPSIMNKMVYVGQQGDLRFQYNYMQALSVTPIIKRYNPESQQQPNDEEGFASQEVQSLIVPKQDALDEFSIIKSVDRRSKIKYRQPKLKLTLLSKQKNSREELKRVIVQKEERRHHGRSLQLSKKDSKLSIQADLLADCVSKIKRNSVGENISIPMFSLSDSKAVKAFILSQGNALIYEGPKEINTHGFIRSIGLSIFEGDFNQLLKNKLRDSYIMPKKITKNLSSSKQIEFNAAFQGSNLQFASEIGPHKYELYLKNDSNTHGHQAWFHFQVKSYEPVSTVNTFNICNIKRDLRLFQEGEKIFVRKIAANGVPSEWQPAGENIQFKINHNNKFSISRVYRLSFDIQLQPDELYEVSLLPSYSYSDLMKELVQVQGKQNVVIEILTYSLIGLAVPLITITSNSEQPKNVILVSCRIHPGETNASYMCRGLLKYLTSNSHNMKDFLDRNIVKIVPMINPDGVIFGNFRTNFLGVDLNRAFDTDDQVINPEVVALKDLGIKLKQEHGDRFNLFLDLHGHSSERNIFTYGPDYDTTQTNFYQIRLLPKILNSKSKFFKYSGCSFKLQDYKRNTARGFFLNSVGVNAYTVESSYAVFTQDGKSLFLGLEDWVKFGQELAESITLLYKLNKLSLIKNRTEMKRALSEADKEELQIIKKFKKEFKKEKEECQVKTQKRKSQNGEDSDGQNQCEDYSRNQREEVIRRVAQTAMPNMILPRVLKPSIIYPTVTPKLFKIRQQFQVTHLKILYTRRSSKYNGLRMHGNNYIHSLKGIDLVKPEKHLFI